MRVGGDGGNPRNAEVEARDVVSKLLAPREDKAAEASVDMQPDGAVEGQGAEVFDGIDRSVAVVARGPDDRDRVFVDELLDRVDVDARVGLVDRRGPTLHVEEVARLVERGVRGLRLHNVREDDPTRAPVLAVSKHCMEDAAGTTAGDEPRRLRFVKRAGVQHVERHGDDLALELRHARAHIALERIHMREERERAVDEVVMLVVAAVHRAGALARLPERVFVARDGRELGEDRIAASTLRGHSSIDREPIGVRVVAHWPSPVGRASRYAAGRDGRQPLVDERGGVNLQLTHAAGSHRRRDDRNRSSRRRQR